MNKLIKKLSSEWVLRSSLAIVYFFSGFDLIFHTKSWYWAVQSLPNLVQNMINKVGLDRYLKLQGAGELAFAIVLLFRFPKKWVMVVAGLIVIEMASILVFVGIDSITFRDIGLLGSALALFVLINKSS